MRTRRRAGVPITVPLGSVHYYGAGGDHYYSGWWPNPTFLPYQEAIWDLGGSKHSGSICGRLAFKPCTHWRVAVNSFTPLTTQQVQNLVGSTPVSWCTGYNNWGVVIEATTPPGMRDYTVDPGLYVHDLVKAINFDYDSGFYQDSWQKCKPSMTTRANMAVFLYELRDFKRMFDVLPKKHFNLKDWRSVLQYGNSQHLNYNFGWKPFIGDLKKTFNGLQSFDERLSRFVSNAGKSLQKGDSTGNEGSDVIYYRPTGWIQYEDVKMTVSWSVSQTSSFQFRYSIPDYSQEELRSRAIADTLGLHLNPANVWAVLPWSFVVDWFKDVGGYLQQYSTDWTNPYIELIQGCHSMKIVYKAELFARYCNHYDSKYHEGVNPFQRVISVSSKQFSRTVGAPQYAVSDQSLNTDRIRLLSSLLASRVL